MRRTKIPGVLVECGFLTNPTEGSYALSANYRQKLAEEIARGIRGLRAPINRPISRGSAASSEVLPQPIRRSGFRPRDTAGQAFDPAARKSSREEEELEQQERRKRAD